MVILLSDGWSTFPNAALTALFRSVQLHDQGHALRVHTVQFPQGDEQGKRILDQIAQAAKRQAARDTFAGASSFIVSIDGIALQEAFVGIAESISGPAGGLLAA